MSDPDYRFLDRLLHRLALHFGPIAEMSFDLDQMLVRADPALLVSQKHVFVSGLARAGTTLLMRRFHATGRYRSLTYRDMPFVLAPNLWRRLALTSRRDIERTERAHGDNLLVDADSPESLDEVYWRIFCGDEYLQRNQLVPHAPGAQAVAKYVRYVNAILSANEPRLERYLSKNNNNILRLGALHQAFPNALILIPFRDPLQHAQSLLRQHVRFSEMQAQREFTLAYMTWLGHHEFGLDHRPFHFAGAAPSTYPPSALGYWLQLWCETYSWLEHSKPKAALFVCYEDLCNRPQTWKRLAELADVSSTDEVGDPLKLSERPVTVDLNSGLAERARTIYSRLVEHARGQLA